MNIKERETFLELFKFCHSGNTAADAIDGKRMDFMRLLLEKNNFSVAEVMEYLDRQLFGDVAAINLAYILDKAKENNKIYFSVSKQALMVAEGKVYVIGYSSLLQNSFMSAIDPAEITYVQLIDFFNANLAQVLQIEANFLKQSFAKYTAELIRYHEIIKDKESGSNSTKNNKPRM